MKRPPSTIAFALGSIASFGIVALGIAAPPGSTGSSASFYAGGHPFGVGEQQVYLIDRESTLTVHYRDRNGELRSSPFRYHAQTSVAWTIEGISSAGSPVLGVTTAAPTPSISQTPTPLAPVPETSPKPPAPSPTLDPQGVAAPAPGTALAEFAPASLVLSGITPQLPDVGKPWKSIGNVQLPFGTLMLTLDNTIVAPTGDQDVNVAQIDSSGTAGFSAKVKVAGFGLAMLHGSGTATATSYLETLNRVLLGTSIAATSHGTATTQHENGTYEAATKIAIKLVKYVPGIVPFTGAGGFVPASDYLGSTTAPDMGVYATTRPDSIAVPAATDTGFIPPPAIATPYESSLPAMPLPPIPLPMASDQPAASPPAGPTPTPQPTHY